jgi:hypothetical protein
MISIRRFGVHGAGLRREISRRSPVDQPRQPDYRGLGIAPEEFG